MPTPTRIAALALAAALPLGGAWALAGGAAAPAGIAARQATPDFSGAWTLDVGRSAFGMMPAPQRQTMTVEQRGAALRTTTVTVSPRGERSASAAYTIDGRPARNAGAGGSEVTSTLAWDGPVLTIASRAGTPQGEVTIADRWSLSADRQTLTIDRRLRAATGDMEQRLVYTRR